MIKIDTPFATGLQILIQTDSKNVKHLEKHTKEDLRGWMQ